MVSRELNGSRQFLPIKRQQSHARKLWLQFDNLGGGHLILVSSLCSVHEDILHVLLVFRG
ncbi:hypothetical protein EG328_010834 [Venturia inaequalis]|uniref:Uncharacterized protein n=1 Tax=Venturia inaequalis TaxID=5025 RepID=A0A8H3V7P7_VENIN|nr:hypothetical protein EG328_010834 [Venturia inaequalis]